MLSDFVKSESFHLVICSNSMWQRGTRRSWTRMKSKVFVKTSAVDYDGCAFVEEKTGPVVWTFLLVLPGCRWTWSTRLLHCSALTSMGVVHQAPALLPDCGIWTRQFSSGGTCFLGPATVLTGLVLAATSLSLTLDNAAKHLFGVMPANWDVTIRGHIGNVLGIFRARQPSRTACSSPRSVD